MCGLTSRRHWSANGTLSAQSLRATAPGSITAAPQRHHIGRRRARHLRRHGGADLFPRVANRAAHRANVSVGHRGGPVSEQVPQDVRSDPGRRRARHKTAAQIMQPHILKPGRLHRIGEDAACVLVSDRPSPGDAETPLADPWHGGQHLKRGCR